MIDHDALFKEVIKKNLWDFLKLFYPKLINIIDTTKPVEFLENELRTKIPGEKKKGDKLIVDIAAKVALKKKDRYRIINIEPQSSYDPRFAERMNGYREALTYNHGLPISSIAVFSYEDRLNQALPTKYEIRDPSGSRLRFDFPGIQLARLHWRDYRSTDNAIAAAFMAKMGSRKQNGEPKLMTYQEQPLVKAECYNSLIKCDLKDTRNQDVLTAFIESYLQLDPMQEKVFQQQLELKEISQGVEMIKSKFTLEGEARGKAEGKAEDICIILNAKSIAFDNNLKQRVSALSIDKLDTLIGKTINFTSSEDLELWLQENAPQS